jgi:predicted porin
MRRGRLHAALLAAVFGAPAAVQAEGIDLDFYGSLRLQVEAANPDGASSYNGLRDAYSRIGFRANATVTDGVGAFAQLELPLDLANGAVQDPFDNDEDIRIAKVGLSTGFGTFAYGQDWMPYYNAIAYPVDMFSTYYSGFATFTSFRVSDSLFYYSPDLNGFSFGASFSDGGGYSKADGSVDDRYQLTASYSFGDTILAAGIDDVGGGRNWRFYGLSVMHTTGDLFIGAKAEVIDSDQSADGFGNDGDTAVNLYVGYTIGKNTIKGMVAEVDNYGGTIFHVGVDHAYSGRLTLFAEYYNEDEGAAIPTRKATDSAPLDAFGSGGDVFAAGVRYSF